MVRLRKHKRRKNNNNRSDASLNRSFAEAFQGVDGKREEALPIDYEEDEKEEEAYVSDRVQDYDEIAEDEDLGFLGRAKGDDLTSDEGDDEDDERAEAIAARLHRDALNDSAADMMRNPISEKARNSYNYQNILFLLYCLSQDKELLSEHAITAFSIIDDLGNDEEGENSQQRKTEKEKNAAKRKIARDLLSGDIYPVKFELITGVTFLRYLLSLRKVGTDGRLSASSYQNKRSALSHLFRSFDVVQPEKLQLELKTAMMGIKRKTAIEKQNGDGRIQVGMEPMSFTIYKFLAQKFLEMNGSDGIFGHCFLVLSWNLACRSKKHVHRPDETF